MAPVSNKLQGARGRLLLLRPSSSCVSTPITDSPGVPPSAGAHQLFRGFSFVATGLMEDGKVKPAQPPLHSVVQVRNGDRGTALWRCRDGPGLQDLCIIWSLRQSFSWAFLPPVVLSSPLTVTLYTGCQGSVELWLCCPQVDLCWQRSINAPGLEVPPKGTVLGAGSIGPLTYICLVLLSSLSPPGGEAVGCSSLTALSVLHLTHHIAQTLP